MRREPPHEYLSEIRAAVKGMTASEERDYLWAVVETIYRPATSHHRWKLVMPSIKPQQMKALDILYRRAGHSVTDHAFAAACLTRPDTMPERTRGVAARNIVKNLRRLFAEYQLPFSIQRIDGGYCLILTEDWPRPFTDFDRT